MKIEERISKKVLVLMREQIEDAEGQEVLFIGRVNAEGIISSIVTAARGSEEAVPALMPFMEKGDVVLHNHPSGVLKPSGQDLSVATLLGNRGIGFYIIDNPVKRIYAVSEPVEKKIITPLSEEETASFLEPGGALAKISRDYENRESQIGMVREVSRLFNDNLLGLMEAGTGVGKSLAYLIPAALWALANDERVVISTATINLQQQLFEKDIPLVEKILRKPVSSLLLKGRGNYLCLRRLEEALEEESLFAETDDELSALRQWAGITDTGDRATLPFLPQDSLWSRVCSEADLCMGLKCRYRERCFILRLRRDAAGALILVVNHHLLFSDLAARVRGAGFDSAVVLPPFSRLIFDEAHNIEKSATSFFSETLSSYSLLKQVSRLYRFRKGKALGLALTLQKYTSESSVFKEIPTAVENLIESTRALDDQTCRILGVKISFRVTEKETQFTEEIFPLLEELRDRITLLTGLCRQALDSIKEEQEEVPAVYETRVILQRLSSFAALCSQFLAFAEYPEKVFWIETTGREEAARTARYIQSPLKIAPMMESAVYEPMKTVLCTSATLTIKGGFNYFRNKIGLDSLSEERLCTGIFPSPFQYREKVLLGIPSDAPDPTSEGFTPFVTEFLIKTLDLSGGRALILFTSYVMLREVFTEVSPKMAEEGILCLKQGDDDRARLLNTFREDTKSVLFATDSFWEGVDAPGESLSVVVLCKLPFKVPTDPILMARMEEIDKKGGNSFFELSLPEAVIKLKQGFGRLMRRSSDRGVVLVLDPRIIRKSYGSFFIKSLPETRTSIKEQGRVLLDLENFLYGG